MNTILDSFKAARSAVQGVLHKWGYQINSSGTKDLSLTAPIDTATGYWSASANVSSKPPRWILHLRPSNGGMQAELAKDTAGSLFPSAGMPGFVNNRNGKCAVAMFRIMPAVNIGATGGFVFPADWEWILVVAFPHPLPSGTSGETLSNFNPSAGTFDYKGDANSTRIPYKASVLGLVLSHAPGTSNPVAVNGVDYTYQDATSGLRDFLTQSGAVFKVCDPDIPADLLDLATAVETTLAATQPSSNPQANRITPASQLLGISSSVYTLINASLAIGKRHFIFYGPPGTGKTTLAEHVAEQLSEDGSSFLELTASSSWSSQDLIGGYQPLGPGTIGFVPGAMLRDFDKPIIIDEMNRCPIDKVIGPLFSVLSGQASCLPYRVNIADTNSDFFKVLPSPTDVTLASEFAPGPAWSMICTLNQVDKTQLGQLSYALSRRFAWVRIGVPEDLRAFVMDMLERLSLIKGSKNSALPNPVADMWEKVNTIRELGGAPIIDFMRLVGEMDPSVDMLSTPNGNESLQNIFILALGASVLPLLDGMRRMDAEDLLTSLATVWHLDMQQQSRLRGHLMELAL